MLLDRRCIWNVLFWRPYAGPLKDLTDEYSSAFLLLSPSEMTFLVALTRFIRMLYGDIYPSPSDLEVPSKEEGVLRVYPSRDFNALIGTSVRSPEKYKQNFPTGMILHEITSLLLILDPSPVTKIAKISTINAGDDAPHVCASPVPILRDISSALITAQETYRKPADSCMLNYRIQFS